MTKNIKSIFFVLALVTLLVTVGSVCAANDTDTTIATDTSVSDAATISDVASDTLAADSVTTTINDNKVDTKTIEKEDNAVKKDSIIIDDVEYATVMENHVFDSDEIILEGNTFINNCLFDSYDGYLSNVDTCLINNSVSTGLYICNDEESAVMIINNSKIDYLYNAGQLYIYNSTLNDELDTEGASTIFIDELSSLGSDFKVLEVSWRDPIATIYTNNTQIINKFNEFNLPGIKIISGSDAGNDSEDYNTIIENQTIIDSNTNFKNLTYINCILNSKIRNYGNLSLINCTLNSTIENNAFLVIENDCIISENLILANTGEIISNNTYDLIPYSTILNGDYTLENRILNDEKTNNGNLTLINCNITARITNNGTLNLINCSLSNNDMSYPHSWDDGYLLYNIGNTTLINCVVENNTFNTTTDHANIPNTDICGAVTNIGHLNVVNTIFQNNTVGYGTHIHDGTYFGVDEYIGYATCIYNNGGNLSINNSLFKDNYAGKDSGAILSQNNNLLHLEASLSIYNTQFINNTAWKTCKGLVISGKETRMENTTITGDEIVMNTDLTLDNCTFNYNSRQSLSIAGNLNMTSSNLNSVSVGARNISVTNNTLNNSWIGASGSADIVDNLFANQSRLSTSSTEYVISIHDNNFTDNNYTSNTVTLPVDQSNTMIFNNTYYNTGLNDSLDWVIPLKSYLNDTINGTYSIGNPEFYDDDLMDNFTFDVYIDDELYMTTTTLDGITLNKTGDIILSVKPLKSSQTFRQNIEVFKLQDVVITPENYDTYIVDGTLTRVKEDDRVLFQGNFTDKGTIYIDTDDVVIDGYDAHFTNTCFVIDSQNTIIQHLNIDNTDTTYPINNIGKNNYIINNNINLTNVDGLTAAIKNTASKVTIKNNVLYVDGPAKTIDYTENGISNTQAILVVGTNKNIIQNNTITVTTTTEGEVYGTIEAITTNGVTDTNITQNTIYASNAKFTYGINMLAGVSDNSITANNITVTSYRYCDGIQVGNQAENILIQDNNINIYCHNTTPVDEEAISYGIITTNMGQGTSNHINIYYNNITIDSTVGYGIEVYQTTNTEIRFNNINVTGAYSMGIGYAHSPNSHVVANNIYCQADSTTTLASVTEEIQPETVGIKIQQDSTNIKIDDGWTYGHAIIGPNTIHTIDKAGTDYAINVESTGATIDGNKLRSTNKIGSNAIKNNTQYSSSNGNGADNIYTNIEIQRPETILVNQTTQITITITDEYGENLQLITLDYNNPVYNEITGNIEYYPYIKDNITVILTIDDQTENITITENTFTYNYTPTTAGTHNITATFQERTRYKIEEGQIQYLGNYNTTTTTQTITVSTITLTVDPITANIGDTINITARITLGNQTYTDINSGKISFKVNGKTLKDTNGKVIYAKVTDGVATIENYIVPNDWSKENTTIQAVYSGSKQCDKLTSEKTPITVTPSTPTITTSDITATAGEEITLAATITDGDNVINNGKVVFKINGKTVKDSNGKVIYAKVSNNQVNFTYTLPADMKAKEYNLTATFISSDYERIEDTKTLTITA